MTVVLAVVLGTVALAVVPRAVPAYAESDTYPWPTAPCEFGAQGGSSCANPGNSSDRWDWFESANGQFSGNGCGAPQPSNLCFDNFGYEYRNCTSYVAQKISQLFNGRSIAGWGNAANWASAATQNRYTLDASPQVGDIAQWGGGFGHVAYVYAVSNGVASLDEYNAGGTGQFSSNRTTAAGSAGPADHYIHMGTPSGSGGSGGAMTDSRVAVVARTAGNMDVFYLDTAHELVNIGWNATNGWGPAGVIAHNAYSNPAAISRGSDSMDIFYRDANNNLMNVGWSAAAGWYQPVARVGDGSVQGDPAVVHRTPDSMDIFYKDAAGNLENIGWTGAGGWGVAVPRVTNHTVASSPVAITRDSGQMSVFYRDGGNDMVEEAWSATNGWGAPGVIVVGDANGDYGAIARGQSSVALVYRTGGSGVGEAGWDATTGWGGAILTGGGTTGNPTLVARTPDSMDVFWHDGQGHLMNEGWTAASGWMGFVPRTDDVGNNPVVVARTSGNMDVFYRSSTGQLTDAWWDANIGWGEVAVAGASGVA